MSLTRRRRRAGSSTGPQTHPTPATGTQRGGHEPVTWPRGSHTALRRYLSPLFPAKAEANASSALRRNLNPDASPPSSRASSFDRDCREEEEGGSRIWQPAMVPSERGSVATAVSTAAADKLLHGPIAGKKCKKAAPRKVHKAEREKLKRDHLNDLFVELGNMLEADRQNNGKACILTDTTRILRDLLVQVETLRKEHNNLQNESHYVAIERNELQDENGVLHKEISELQDELRMRTSSNPAGWGHVNTGLNPPVPHPTSAVFSSQQQMQPPTIQSTVFPLQQPLALSAAIERSYATPPSLELKLFPGAASVEVHEQSEDQEAPNHVARPHARYPTQSASWPVTLFSGLPRMEDEQCSRSTTGCSKEASTGRD